MWWSGRHIYIPYRECATVTGGRRISGMVYMLISLQHNDTSPDWLIGLALVSGWSGKSEARELYISFEPPTCGCGSPSISTTFWGVGRWISTVMEVQELRSLASRGTSTSSRSLLRSLAIKVQRSKVNVKTLRHNIEIVERAAYSVDHGGHTYSCWTVYLNAHIPNSCNRSRDSVSCPKPTHW